jgi:hypothetical protein
MIKPLALQIENCGLSKYGKICEKRLEKLLVKNKGKRQTGTKVLGKANN